MSQQGILLDRAWLMVLEDLRVSVTDLLRMANLPEGTIVTGRRLSLEEYVCFWASLEVIFDNPLFPIHVARAFTTASYSPLVLAAASSPNAAIAYQRIGQFKGIFAPFWLEAEEVGDGLVARFGWYEEPVHLPSSHVATEMAYLVQIARTATRVSIAPIQASSSCALASKNALEEFIGCPITLDAHNQITLSIEDAKRPFLSCSTHLWESFEPELWRRLNQLSEHTCTKVRVQSVLVSILPSGDTSRSTVANELAMSERALSRALRREGTSFTQVLAHTRESLAKSYLQSKRLDPLELALLLGYSDVSSFARAFKQWTGMTLGRHRMALNA